MTNFISLAPTTYLQKGYSLCDADPGHFASNAALYPTALIGMAGGMRLATVGNQPMLGFTFLISLMLVALFVIRPFIRQQLEKRPSRVSYLAAYNAYTTANNQLKEEYLEATFEMRPMPDMESRPAGKLTHYIAAYFICPVSGEPLIRIIPTSESERIPIDWNNLKQYRYIKFTHPCWKASHPQTGQPYIEWGERFFPYRNKPAS